jgi:hypothetical protein
MIPMETTFPTLAERIKCDKAHLRQIFAWQEPYCISSSRKKPVAVANENLEIYGKYCCSDDFRECPFYKPGLLTRIEKGDRIPAPADVSR